MIMTGRRLQLTTQKKNQLRQSPTTPTPHRRHLIATGSCLLPKMCVRRVFPVSSLHTTARGPRKNIVCFYRFSFTAAR